MARNVNRLSARQVATLTLPGRHADGNRLHLSIGKQGQRRWVYLFNWKGRTVEMGLGSIKDVTLAHARTKARDAGALLADEVNPVEYRYTRADDRLMELGLKPQVLSHFRAAQLDAQEAAMQDLIDETRKSVEELVGRIQ